MYRYSSINIPISLCVYSARNGLTGQLSLFVFLKAWGDGTVKDPTTLCQSFCKAKACSKSSFYNWLNWLIVNKWIYKVSDHVFVVNSFSNLIKNAGIPIQSNRSCIFNLTDLHQFKGFICAAIITYFGKLKAHRDASVGTKKGRTLYSGRSDPGLSVPVLYLAKAMDVSKTTALDYFKSARPFLEIRHRYELIDSNPGNLTAARKYGGYKPGAVVLHHGTVCLQLPNTLISPLIVHKMKSLKSLFVSKIPTRNKGRL